VRSSEWTDRSRRPGVSVSPSTYHNRLSILSPFYTHAIRKCQQLQYNPIERLEPRKVGKKDAARPLADSQVKEYCLSQWWIIQSSLRV
jgi:hypothetical protein